MNEDIQFLKEIQEEMKTQETDGQSEPRCWSIMDYKLIPTSEDHADSVTLYDNWDCNSIDIIDYVHDIVDFEGDRYEEFDKEQRIELKDIFDYEAPSEIVGWIEENDEESRYSIVFLSEVSFIAYNTCFFTKAEAKQHLERNRHHYSDKAHTFAMSAWRAPKMERLIKILETFDWDSIRKNH